MGERICSVVGCGRVADSGRRGWCGMHYSRWRTKGDPLAPMLRDPNQSDEERFWARVDTGDCWHWTGTRTRDGYGLFTPRGGKTLGAHRWAYGVLVGAISAGMQLDHLCRNRSCVNPDHLEPVTQGENFRRGVVSTKARLRARCRHGHDWTPENTYITKRGRRSCRECNRRNCAAHYRRATRAVVGLL